MNNDIRAYRALVDKIDSDMDYLETAREDDYQISCFTLGYIEQKGLMRDYRDYLVELLDDFDSDRKLEIVKSRIRHIEECYACL